MHVAVNGVQLFLDVEGSKLVPDGPVMREKPTLLLLHGGAGADHSICRPPYRPWPISPRSSISTTVAMGAARMARENAGTGAIGAMNRCRTFWRQRCGIVDPRYLHAHPDAIADMARRAVEPAGSAALGCRNRAARATRLQHRSPICIESGCPTLVLGGEDDPMHPIGVRPISPRRCRGTGAVRAI